MTRRAFVLAIGIMCVGCGGLSKIDYTRLGRASWQHPEAIVVALGIRPGDRVADVGAGDGYFLPYFSRAVGPAGRVVAVEVEEEKAEALRVLVREEGLSNVDVVLGAYADPGLPDGALDVVFLCNTYHHVEDRSDYFARLQTDLRPGGRVAIVDMKDDLTGILGLFTDEGHWMNLEEMRREMQAAGYVSAASYAMLPVQNFEVFVTSTKKEDG